MGSEITISSKGQIAIPKDVRDRLGLVAGRKLRLTEAGGAIVLRPSGGTPGLSFDEAMAQLHAVIRYDGPPVSIEEMNDTIDECWAASARRRDDRSRY